MKEVTVVTEYGYIEVGADPKYLTLVQQLLEDGIVEAVESLSRTRGTTELCN